MDRAFQVALLHHGSPNKQALERISFLETRLKEQRSIINDIQKKILEDPFSQESLSMEDLIRLSEIDTVCLCRCMYEVHQIVMESDAVSMSEETRARLATIFRNSSSM